MANIMRLGGGSGGGVKLPEGYTALPYIKGDGAMVFDTGIVPTNATVIEAKVGTESGDIYMGCVSSGSTRFGIYGVKSGRFDLAYGNAGYFTAIESGVTFPAEITLKNGSFTANGTTVTFATQSAFSGLSTLKLFSDGTYTMSGEIYRCKIYEGETLIRDYVPCSSGLSNGFYDLANNEFNELSNAPVLLWTNASPMSEFAPQTINLPTGYSGYIVEVADKWGGVMQYPSCGYIPLFSGNAKGIVAYFNNSGRHYTYTRVVSSAANGSITFGGGNSGGAIHYDDANHQAIPQRIWGVKFTL